MPTVPDYGVPTERVTPLRPAQASPGEFAQPGRNLQNLGNSLSDASNAGMGIVIKMQEQENIDTVFRAETSLKEVETAFHNHVREKLGANAKGVTQEAAKFWDKHYKDLDGSLANDAQRRAFDKIALDRRNSSLDFVSRHEAVEKKRAASDAAEASVKASIEASIANPGAIDTNVTSIANTYKAIGAVHGWEPEVTESKIATAVTAAHVGVVGAMVDQNPGGARVYYNKHKSQILPSHREKIESALRAGGLKEFSQQHATSLEAKHGDDYKAAIDEARATIKDADRQEATVSQLKARWSESQAAEKQGQAGAFDDAMKLIVDPQSAPVRTIYDLPAATLDRMSGSDLARVKEYLTSKIEGPPQHDNLNALTDAQMAIERGDITDPRQLEILQGQLTQGTYKTLLTQLEKSKTISNESVLREFENRIGETRTKWLDDADTQIKWRAFQDHVYRGVQEGTRPQDIRNLADDFFLEAYKPNTGLFFNDKKTLGEARAAGETGYYAPTPKHEVPVVTGSMDLLRRYGIDVPEGKVAQDKYYTEMYLPASRYLVRQSMPVTQRNVAAFMALQQRGYEISPDAITNMAGQMR